MRIIPAIDIIDGKCVRLTQGDFSRKTIYSANPIDVAKEFENNGIKYLHLVDLDGAKSGSVVNWKVVESLTSQTTLTIDFGGGVKTDEEISRLFDTGVTQVNLGSIAVNRPYRIYEWIEKFGKEKIILSADVRENKVAINGWEKNSEIEIKDFIKGFVLQGLSYVTCTDIQTDGMLSGPNVRLYKEIISVFPNLKLIASGGVSSKQDLDALKEIKVDGVIIGKAIYENKITLPELLSFKS
jgi:phosphoribosylformimino-5-aminoimidazole carboxamide ribotide isomerase